MDPLNLHLWTCDVGALADTPEVYARLISDCVLQSWDEGADLVLFPEYTWMGLERFVTGSMKLRGVAELFWQQQWPALRHKLARPGKAVVLGSVPFLTADGKLRNRAPIICDARELFQDKLRLTPWESAFTGGEDLLVWKFKDVTFAVQVCLDIEVPETAALLRGRGVDCLLVPSATETILGVERIARCASARAVELGCCVAVAHLTGRSQSELVDQNLGCLGFYSPSLGAFMDQSREKRTPVVLEGFELLRVTLNKDLLLQARADTVETNPALLAPQPIIVRETA
jgi:predicted amidohydrolase